MIDESHQSRKSPNHSKVVLEDDTISSNDLLIVFVKLSNQLVVFAKKVLPSIEFSTYSLMAATNNPGAPYSE